MYPTRTQMQSCIDPREESNRLNTLYPDAPPAFLVPPATVELIHDNQEDIHGSHT